MDFTTAMLQERHKTHGSYDDDARCAMRLIDELAYEEALRSEPLSFAQRHALHMILHKIARIVAGRADFKDHWDDIAGYAKLVADRCVTLEEPTGCADDCVHPSHRHGRPGRREDDHQEENPYKVERVTLTDVRTPVNGADVLGINKPPCHCAGTACMVDTGHAPRYVYCKKAEA